MNELEVTEDDGRYYFGNKVTDESYGIMFHAVYLPIAKRKMDIIKKIVDKLPRYIKSMTKKVRYTIPIDHIMVDNKEGLYGYHSEEE